VDEEKAGMWLWDDLNYNSSPGSILLKFTLNIEYSSFNLYSRMIDRHLAQIIRIVLDPDSIARLILVKRSLRHRSTSHPPGRLTIAWINLNPKNHKRGYYR
jgi:hypothetical protein